MNKIKVGVIFGGQSTEHDVSIVSGSSVIKNFNKNKYDIYPIYISKDGKWYHYVKPINEIEIFEIGEEPRELEEIENEFEILRKQDIVFPVLHGLYGEDGTIQGLLELLCVPYVGCKVLASSVCMDKVYTKMIFEKAHIKQAKSITINAMEKDENTYIYIDEELNYIEKNIEEICDIAKEKFGYPMFVKPSNSGSSVGVSKAIDDKELIKAMKEARKFDREILIEQGINGKEVECAVLGTIDVKASCVGQILSADEFYDFDSKYINPESKVIIPADIPEETTEKVREIAIKAFKAVKGSGLARVDFFVDKETNEIYINEINTMPGFTNISMYPKLWENCGIKYPDLLDQLINMSL